MEISLPQKWTIVQVNGSDCIIGIHIDSELFSYQIYVIDLFKYSVWFEIKPRKDIISDLESKGFLDIDEEKQQVFLDKLSSFVYDEQLSVSAGEDGLSFSFKDKSVDWEFNLKVDETRTSEILCKYIMGQVTVVSRQKYQLNSLLDTIHERDRYTKYLKENYRLINGDGLLKKYSKINPNPDIVNDFDAKSWKLKVQDEYTSGDHTQMLKDVLSETVEDEITSPKKRTYQQSNEPKLSQTNAIRPGPGGGDSSTVSPKKKKRGMLKSRKKA